MACSDSVRHFKLLPIGGVAACLRKQEFSLSHEGSFEECFFPPINGQVFCYLPLPTVVTNIPVHLHACWELSSNRRDIWKGDDTKGEAKLRSDWNLFVMKDVLAPM